VEVVGKDAKAFEYDPDGSLLLGRLPKWIDQLEAKMKEAAKKFEFKDVANLWDQMKKNEKQIICQ